MGEKKNRCKQLIVKGRNSITILFKFGVMIFDSNTLNESLKINNYSKLQNTIKVITGHLKTNGYFAFEPTFKILSKTKNKLLQTGIPLGLTLLRLKDFYITVKSIRDYVVKINFFNYKNCIFPALSATTVLFHWNILKLVYRLRSHFFLAGKHLTKHINSKIF